jgi:hypothetical protein
MGKVREEALKMVDDNYAKNLLNEEFGVDFTRGFMEMEKKSLVEEKDTHRAGVENTVEALLEQASQTESMTDKMKLMEQVNFHYDVALKNKYFTAQEVEELQDQNRESFANTIYVGLTPEEQIAELDKAGAQGHWANWIPAEKRAVLKARAEKSLEEEQKANEADRLKGEAISWVLDMEDRGMDAEEMQAAAESKYARTDPKKFLYIESRTAANKAQDEKLREASAVDVYNKWSSTFFLDEDKGAFLDDEGNKQFFTFEDIPEAEIDELRDRPDLLANLKNLSDERLQLRNVPQIDDRANLNMVMNQIQQASNGLISWEKASLAYGSVSATLTPETRSKYEKILMEKSVPELVKSEFTASQLLESQVKALNIKDEAVTDMKMRFNEWQRQYQHNNNGKIPSDADKEKYIDGLFLKYDADGWGGDERVYMDPDVDPMVASDHFEEFKRLHGREPDENEMRKMMDQYEATGRYSVIRPPEEKTQTARGGR